MKILTKLKKSQFASQRRRWHIFCVNCKKEVLTDDCDLEEMKNTREGEVILKGKHVSCGADVHSIAVLR